MFSFFQIYVACIICMVLVLNTLKVKIFVMPKKHVKTVINKMNINAEYLCLDLLIILLICVLGSNSVRFLLPH